MVIILFSTTYELINIVACTGLVMPGANASLYALYQILVF